MRKHLISILFFVCLSNLFCIAQTVAPYKNPKFPIEQRIKDLLSKMTLEEKVGQLNQVNGGVMTGPAAEGDPGAKAKLDMSRKGMVGSFLNVTGAKETRAVQEIAVKESRLGIPLLFAFDVIHGYKTIFPIPLAETCSWDLALMEKSASMAAAEASSAGLHWTFAPMVDIARDPRWGRVMEGAGEDTYMGSKASYARVKGFQGDLTDVYHVMACMKHFAAYGLAEGGREYNTVDLSRYALQDIYLPPFKAGVDAGAATVMNSFNIVDGIPASGNKYLVTDVLKNQWKFKGFVVSDWASFGEMITHGYAADSKDAALKAFNAGSDMDMESRVVIENMVQLVKEGKVTQARLDDAVSRILYYKFKLGLFEDPYKFSDERRESVTLLNDKFVQAAREASQRSMILLKNDNNTLPLSKTTKNIAVIGQLADSQADALDFWIAKGEPKDVVTILQGIKNKVPQSNVSFAKGYTITTDGSDALYNSTEATIAEAVNTAKSADVVIAVVGLSGKVAGEARALTNIEIPAEQMKMLQAVKATGKPVIVVVSTGRPMVIPWLSQNVPAILYAWMPCTQGGNAAADILFGDYNPSAKTTMSFPYTTGQIPVYYNQKSTGRPYQDEPNSPGNFWVSRYRDAPNGPLYPFGYGLSYTTFDYSAPTLNKVELNRGENLVVKVTIKNTGKYDGEEIAQLYIRDMVASLVRPVKELKGFQKIMLKTGESKEVTFTLTNSDLSFYDGEGKSHLEPGTFKVFIGGNSRDVKEVSFSLK
ncbi:beta-glucosidase BglX [Cytophagaceae bacterium YF14B1]|uniref:beta-glucosidase n=1 Tax=Xanthocytophaga flava TaxID=3048013 RepID=A0AAE3QPC6_9BACT|nr:beta-glucosidase BglX [Xanthocytophaga flavus]MDJ1480414.1 beta-glucosidase BglX [Xanthocytophaga flavus]